MKTMKKLMALLVVCLMMAGLMSFTAFADGDTMTMAEVWSMLGSSVFERSGSTVKATGETGNESFTFEDAGMETFVLPVPELELVYDPDWDCYCASTDDLYIEVMVRDGALYAVWFSGVYDTSEANTYDYDGHYIDSARERDGSFYYPWDVGATAEDHVVAYCEYGMFTVTGIGAMKDFDDPADTPWNGIASEISTLMIDEGVTSVGKNAFAGVGTGDPIYLTLASTIETIGDGAFADLNATDMTQLAFSVALTSIGARAFANDPVQEMIFLGNVPAVADDAFTGVTAKVNYLYGSDWTEAAMLNYGGELSYEICYVVHAEEEYTTADGEMSGEWTMYVPNGELVTSLEYDDCTFAGFEVVEGTLPEGIDFTNPELNVQMVDNLSLKIYYICQFEDDVDDDDDDDDDVDDGDDDVEPVDPDPVKPVDPKKDDPQIKGRDIDTPDTSDETNPLFWLGMLLISTVTLALTFVRKKEN